MQTSVAELVIVGMRDQPIIVVGVAGKAYVPCVVGRAYTRSAGPGYMMAGIRVDGERCSSDRNEVIERKHRWWNKKFLIPRTSKDD